MRRAVILLCLFAASCGEWDQPLTGGYTWVGVDGDTGLIEGPTDGRIAVYPNVVEAEASGRFIVGKRELAASNTDNSSEFSTGLGYFILDTRSGAYAGGLTETQFKAELRRHDLDSDLL